ncbi:MAG: DUF58 domain-containing protein [Candidatus Omnitrophica bacterium]|nr:DUF58 domain-containing protein [Candidatus Omnitrophota bacterium]
MIPKEILKKIRRIQITTSRMVTDVFAGQYHSVFKGKGMEFDEVREYLPGDDIRSIDWNVTARMGHPYIKKFVEERELTVMLLLDASSSSNFGSVNQLKKQLAAEISSVLAFSAIQNNDKVGLIIFTDRIEKFIPPRKGTSHVLRVIREALYYKAEGKGTDISGALDFLNRVTKRRTIAFIISDFFDSGFKNLLSASNKRHDIIAVTITDPREIELPKIGIVELDDAETASSTIVDTGDDIQRAKYKDDSLKRIKERLGLLNSVNVDSIDILTDKAYTKELIRFFKAREKRLA